MKQKGKNAVDYVCRFEGAVADEARSRGFEGVVCGHIHHAAIERMGDIVYINDGDWVESCTAPIEDGCGTLEILRWPPFDESRTADLSSEPVVEIARVAA